MDKAEFDKFAQEYAAVHAQNINFSGESPDFFAEYKIRDTARMVSERLLNVPARILDFGAGVGNSTPYFQKYFPSSDLVSLDVSEKSLSMAKKRFPDNVNHIQFDGNRLPFIENSFDIVFSACVFHHISQEEHVHLLRELRRVLSPQGRIIIFEHNPYNPLTRHAVNNCPFDENAVLLKPGLFKQKFIASGFAQIEMVYRIFFPNKFRLLRVIEPFIGWLPLGAQYYITAGKNV